MQMRRLREGIYKVSTISGFTMLGSGTSSGPSATTLAEGLSIAPRADLELSPCNVSV